MRFPRMTTRRWMVAVAVVGIMCGVAGALKDRRTALTKAAELHAWEVFQIEQRIGPEPDWRNYAAGAITAKLPPQPSRSPGVGPPSDDDAWEAFSWWLRQQQRIAYHQHLMNKYLRAARYPWLPVAPDPPAPE